MVPSVVITMIFINSIFVICISILTALHQTGIIRGSSILAIIVILSVFSTIFMLVTACLFQEMRAMMRARDGRDSQDVQDSQLENNIEILRVQQSQEITGSSNNQNIQETQHTTHHKPKVTTEIVIHIQDALEHHQCIAMDTDQKTHVVIVANPSEIQ